VIDRVAASKRVGWEKKEYVPVPSPEDAAQLLKGVMNEEQDAYEEVLRIHRYATAEEMDSQAGRIIWIAFCQVNHNHKHIYV
jgi:hypothetical protein